MERRLQKKLKTNGLIFRLLLVAVLSLAMTVGAAVPPENDAYAASGSSKTQSIKLNHKIITVKKGKTVKLKASVKPSKAKKRIIWRSSNKKIAKVSKTGKVLGRKKGKVKITASIKGTKKKATCTVYVGTPVKRVILTKKSSVIKVGKTIKIKAKLNPRKATVKGFKYSSSNKKVATVNKKGVVTAKKAGKVTIKVSARDEAGKAAKFKVTVKPKKKTCVDYKYEVIPLTPTFNRVFYIKTDNPDPDSFCFADESTVYNNDGGRITPDTTFYSDVVYESTKKLRVHGGYLAYGSDVDGGKLRLMGRKVTDTYNVTNISTGEVTSEKEYSEYKTDVRISIPELKDTVDYLIDKYDSGGSYFDRMNAIQNGFSSECLYSGIYILGTQLKSTDMPYYGLSTSPHVDQIFYIQDPYYRKDGKYMLVTQLYPLIYDSIGFPSVMGAVAERLDPNVSVEWSQDAHYLINVTRNGETRSYGGAGTGKGQGIHENQIKYRFSFDNSAGDSYPGISIEAARRWITEYSEIDVPEEPKDQPELTWASVRKTVGRDGSYVKLMLINSIFGFTSDGYTFMYDDGSDYEGTNGWGAVGHFSNAWYDGRYFNKWEHFYSGATFKETVETENPSIILKDPVIRIPDDGKTYLYNYDTIEEAQYNRETGAWNGFVTYYYDSANNVWKSELLDSIRFYDNSDYRYKEIEDSAFVDACTITMEEALAMNLDANTNKDPAHYFIYDGKVRPGTYH